MKDVKGFRTYSLTAKGVCACNGLNYQLYSDRKVANYMLYGANYSGRTTNIIVEALVQASKGVEVVLMADCIRSTQLMNKRAKHMAWWCGLEPDELFYDRHRNMAHFKMSEEDYKIYNSGRFYPDHTYVQKCISTINLHFPVSPINKFMKHRDIKHFYDGDRIEDEHLRLSPDLNHTYWQIGSYRRSDRHCRAYSDLHLDHLLDNHYRYLYKTQPKFTSINPYAEGQQEHLNIYPLDALRNTSIIN